MYKDWKKAILKLEELNSSEVLADLFEVKPVTVDGWIKKAKDEKGGKTPFAPMQKQILKHVNTVKADKKIVAIPKKPEPERKKTGIPIVPIPEKKAVCDHVQPSDGGTLTQRPTPKPVPPKQPRADDEDLTEALRGLNIRAEEVFRMKSTDKGYGVNHRHILCFVTQDGKKHFWHLIKNQPSNLEEYQKRLI